MWTYSLKPIWKRCCFRVYYERTLMRQPFPSYRPQRSWAKVIFSQACVCPQGGGVCLIACWDTPGADPPGPGTPQSRHHHHHPPPRTRHPHWVQTPPGKQTLAYSLRAAGTHPTGMHSCFIVENFVLFGCIFPFFSHITHFTSERQVRLLLFGTTRNFILCYFCNSPKSEETWFAFRSFSVYLEFTFTSITFYQFAPGSFKILKTSTL